MSYSLIANNDYNAYRRYALSIPNLTKEEEFELTLQKDNGDLAAAQKLILSQLKTVIYIAKKYSGYGFNQEDLIQEGNIGLMKAVKNFNPNKNVRLFTYSLLWIRAEIQSFILNNWKIVKIGTSKNLKKLFFNYRKILSQLIGHSSSINNVNMEISKRLNVSLDDVEHISSYFMPDEEINDELILSSNNTPEYYLSEKDNDKLLVDLKHKIENLNDNEKTVINMKYLSAIDEKVTNKDIAEKMGLSSERVRQIESKALSKLKNQA